MTVKSSGPSFVPCGTPPFVFFHDTDTLFTIAKKSFGPPHYGRMYTEIFQLAYYEIMINKIEPLFKVCKKQSSRAGTVLKGRQNGVQEVC
jgi:hypothetical protein